MQARFDELSGMYVLHLERGEPFNKTIETFAGAHNIGGALVQAIGAIENPVLGYYHLGAKIYEWKQYAGIFELNMSGANITRKDGQPFLHAHPTIAGPDHIACMGHLREATVGVIVECFILPVHEPIDRRMVETIGLSCWHIE